MAARRFFNIKCANRSLELSRSTAIMGVLNITPDSFSDGNVYYNNVSRAVDRAKKMLEEGADIIDVGGESTRPGSTSISAEEEIKRVVPVIRKIRGTLGKDVFISIDTYKARVAEEALGAGADIVNSLSGFTFDGRLAGLVKRSGCPIIIYHIKGKPKTMQKGRIRYNCVIKEIARFFQSQVATAKANGIRRSQILIDPGIGFGKTLEQNLEIITSLGEFSSIGLPIVIGMSRKSHLGQMLKEGLGLEYTPGPSDRLEASLAEAAIAITQGAHIIRTHDVLQTKKFTASIDALLESGNG